MSSVRAGRRRGVRCHDHVPLLDYWHRLIQLVRVLQHFQTHGDGVAFLCPKSSG